MPSRLRGDRSFVHADLERARLERAERLERGDERPSYEVRERSALTRELAGGWAERVLSSWLEELGASEVQLERSGADLRCRAGCSLGPLEAELISPFQADRRVSALCEPCLVRVELGARPARGAEAWGLRRGGSVVAFLSSGEGWLGAVLAPSVAVGLLPAAENTWLGWRALSSFLEELRELAALDAPSRREALFREGEALADLLGPRRWREARALRPARWQRPRGRELLAMVGELCGCFPFEEALVVPGRRGGFGASLVRDSSGLREVLVAPFFLEARLRGRAARYGLDLAADLFHLQVPRGVHRAAELLPPSWAVVRLSLARAEAPDGVERRLFWLEGARLVGEGLPDRALRDLLELVAAHQGPYR